MKPWEAGYVLLVEPKTVGDAIRECASEIARLREELSATTRERGIEHDTANRFMWENNELRQKLAAVTAERDELVKALQWVKKYGDLRSACIALAAIAKAERREADKAGTAALVGTGKTGESK